MFIASDQRTTSGARQFVQDRGIDLKRPASRRDKLVALSRKWAEEQARKAENDRRIAEMLRRAAEREAWRLKEARSLAERLAIRQRQGHPHMIIEAVAFWHETTLEKILSPSRNRKVCEARYDAVCAVLDNCKVNGRAMYLTDLGRVFDRDHTTILSALRKRGKESAYDSGRHLRKAR